jgi:cysteine synthase A
MVTIPQIFVAGEFVGGCTETFDAFNDGKLQTLFEKGGVTMSDAERRDAYSFLPGWLHPRLKASAA